MGIELRSSGREGPAADCRGNRREGQVHEPGAEVPWPSPTRNPAALATGCSLGVPPASFVAAKKEARRRATLVEMPTRVGPDTGSSKPVAA